MEITGIALGLVGPFQIVLIIIITVFLALFPILAIIDIVRNDFKGNDKLIWVLVTLLLPFLGPLLYFIIGRKNRLQD